MKIKFCGAAQTVTGSAHLLTLDNGYQILLDCGLYQGHDKDFENFNTNWKFEPKNIDCVILSHAHIDHSGRLPKLVKDGFKGDIICTHATRDLAAIMLLDSAFIQKRDAEFINKRKGRSDYGKVKPLYVPEDVPGCMNKFVSIGYERWHRVCKNVDVLLRDSGHILGSASVTLRITENGETFTFGFTGDIGRPERPILRDPVPMPACDYIISESTYGNKLHGSKPAEEEKLLEIVTETCVKNGGKLIIPAFSVGRTQEIVYMLDRLETFKKLPHISVFVDSPLAINATDVFQSHPECFDANILDYMLHDPNPFGFRNLHYVRKVEQSKSLNTRKEPCVIISASGMITAGRIKHHIYNHIESPRNTVLMVGYCAPHTLGGRFREGVEEIRIFGEEKKVRAKVEIMDSFSAHGDQREMIDYLDNQKKTAQKIFLVHGDYDRQRDFKDKLKENGFNNIYIPSFGQEFYVN